MNKAKQATRFILAGTPCSGKTSVLLALEKLGYTTVHESATDLIRLETANGTQEPWPWEGDDFINKIVQLQKERQLCTLGNLQFYDRSPFCTYALSKYLSNFKNIEFIPSDILLNEIDRCLQNGIYQNRVLFFENLGFVEYTDVRKISYQDALSFEQIHLNIYKKFGFKPILVPRDTIRNRCDFVLKTIKL